MDTIKKINIESKTIETADTLSSEILVTTKKRGGFIPNMYATMANNAALIDA